MFSIYHFFKYLLENKKQLVDCEKLDDIPYDQKLLSFKSIGKFPDMAIRLNAEKSDLTGGELIELKDSRSYSFHGNGVQFNLANA